VISHTTAQFRKMFSELPAKFSVKPAAHTAPSSRTRIIQVFVSSPFTQCDPSTLRGSAPIIRAVGVLDGDEIIWYWIGSHGDYDKLLSQSRRGR